MLFLIWFFFTALKQSQASKDLSHFSLLCVALFLFSIPAVGGWEAYRERGIWPFLLGGGLASLLSVAVLGRVDLFIFPLFYVLFFILLKVQQEEGDRALIETRLSIEKLKEQKVELDAALRKLSQEELAARDQYEIYYGLREVAERLAATRSIDKLANQLVAELRHLFPKGEGFLIYLTEPDGMGPSLVGCFTSGEPAGVKQKKGDLIDQWVLQNRQRLLVTDILKDYRFDPRELDPGVNVQSLISAPLFEEKRVLGILRVQASKAEVFDIEDLRLLDTLANLASSAFSNALLFRKTEELAIRDSLTGLFVHRYFRERLNEEHQRALLSHTELSLLMADLDGFKAYNDRYGHGAGDMILVRIAQLMKSEVGEGGMVARYGGEEFAVILPRYTKRTALELAERIRSRIEGERLEVRREPTRMTLSIGVATLPQDALELESLILRADQNLYQAKREGRNKVSGGAG